MGGLFYIIIKQKLPGNFPRVQFIQQLSLRGSAYRTCASASTAANAGVSVDNVLAVTLGNCVYRAALSASAASDAIVRNYVCHIDLPPYKYCSGFNRCMTAAAYSQHTALSLLYCNIFSEKVKCFLKIFTRFSSAKLVAVRG